MDEPPLPHNPYSTPAPDRKASAGGKRPNGPSGPGGPTPRVWTWYVVYCIAMAILYAAVFLLGAFLLLNRSQMAELPAEDTMLMIQGIALCGLGLVLTALFAAAPLLPKRKWAWFYGFLAIGIGLTSPCCLPASLPLVLFWLKDDTKKFFNVGD